MRRLARHLFTLCSAVSLLLCVAICVLWVRSWRLNERYFASYVIHGSFRLETAGGIFKVRYRPALGDAGPSGRSLRYGQSSEAFSGQLLTPTYSLKQWSWGPLVYASRDWPEDPGKRTRARQAELTLDEWVAEPSSGNVAKPPATPQNRVRADIADIHTKLAAEFMARYGAVHELLFPAWIAAMVSAAAPGVAAFAFVRRRRRRRQRARVGLCPVCGYDLRASPERCPECGTPAK